MTLLIPTYVVFASTLGAIVCSDLAGQLDVLQAAEVEIVDQGVAASSDSALQGLEDQLVQVAKRARQATVAITFDHMSGHGSGVIVSRDGIVLSAGHCVMNPGQEVNILLGDGRKFRAEGIGLEKEYDCGLFKIDAAQLAGQELPFVELGWSSQLRKGEPVFSTAHGGVRNTDRGPYLRFGRVISPVSSNNGFIQSTCLMEPGDSGGPLFNMDGRLVGLRSRIGLASLDENYDVPVDLYRFYWGSLHLKERFQWKNCKEVPSFGVQFEVNTLGAIADLFGFGGGSICIASVDKPSWALEMKLREGDYLLTWNGDGISSIPALNARMISAFALGESVEIGIKRGDQKKLLELDFSEFGDLRSRMEVIQPNRESSYAGKRAVEALARLASATRALEQQLDDYSVMVSCGAKQIPATLVFWRQGHETSWVVGSSSLIERNEVTVLLESGQSIPGTVTNRSQGLDLALIRLSQPALLPQGKLSPLTFSDRPIGRILVSVSQCDDGHTSVKSAPIFSSSGRGRLGIVGKSECDQFIIEELESGAAADQAGLKVNDQIISLDGTKVSSLDDVLKFLRSTVPGQKINASISRDGITIDVEITLSRTNNAAPGPHAANWFKGGKSKETSFQRVLLHDAPVLSSRCGSPVFDLKKNFVGMNIARASRTRTYIIPASEVIAFVDEIVNGY
ncbi:trypsin-like peptidase domain-containing protein [Blastopirellula retiformator]|nr:trypsin-like peptidase domain-containing protein [Blastopirellula retiformator]